MNRDFYLVDVFGVGKFSGNPLAVVNDAANLDSETMQEIARWLNLSETAFLLPPSTDRADYRVRIFTLERELPFAGHPTLGSCRAWLAAGGVAKDNGLIVQECGAGLVRIRAQPRLAFAAPPLLRSGPVDATKRAEIAGVLNMAVSEILDAQWVDNGPGWIAVLLASAEDVLKLEPVHRYPTRVDVGVVGPYALGASVSFELRAFFSDHRGALVEDPVTGSLNASVAQWLISTGRAKAPYVAAQGTRVGRSGRIHIATDPQGDVWIGGDTRILFSGKAHLD
ncbi:MAG: PhzF family phenazine biosynthesis protein [Gammaproteobacteria bacterium]|nr:PhzF family phenazine biosynthesis protein [Gammaproteobacteria bacterium]